MCCPWFSIRNSNLVDFLHCIPYSLFELIKFKHWCFKNLVFDVTPKKEIKWGYIRAPCGPGYWTTPPNPSVLKCPVRMKSGALLAGSKSHTSIYQQQVTNKIICLSGVKTKIQIDGFVSKFLVFSLNDYVQ